MNKSKKSIYIALSSVSLTLINGLLGLFVTRLIIINYGSDFNGLNSTVNQFINMLLIIEGGFTLATSVALFKPLGEKNHKMVNAIMTATRKTFFKIGLFFLLFGFLGSIIYTKLINSDLPWEIVFFTFLMTVVSTAFNLLYATKYRILLQTEQREYIINIINIGTLILSQILIVIIIFYNGHMLLVRFITMVASIINSLIIGYISKKNYKYINFSAEPNFMAIKGTKDLFIQKFTGMLYSSVPIIYISATVGTMYASVYAVYNSIFALIKSLIYSLVNAPRMGLGQLIAEKEERYILKIFYQYEFVVVNVTLCLLSTGAVLIIPFIDLYTKGITDIEYENWYIAIILIATVFFEIIHIPSGNLINMSGNFNVGRKIQTFASIVLIILMFIGNMTFSFYGILGAVLITSILLAILEIGYVHKIYFKSNAVPGFLRIVIPNLILSIILVSIEIILLPEINGYVKFFLVGFIVLVINGMLMVLFNLIINKSLTIEIYNRVSVLTHNKLQRNTSN